jgi:hypothetical protein
MSPKAKTLTLKPKTSGKGKKSKRTYSSLANGPAPAERLAKLLQKAAARGVRPMTEEGWGRLIEAHRGAWPNESEIDEFISWLQQARREGRYR